MLKIFITAVFLVAAIIGIWGFLVPAMERSNDVYTGQEIFNTKEEYQAFKQTLVDTNARFGADDMVILSSEPPIIASFSVIVDHGINFPYGETSGHGEVGWGIFFTFIVLMVVTGTFAGIVNDK